MKRLVYLLGVVVCLLAVFPVSNFFLRRGAPVLAVGAGDPALARACAILNEKCLDCHSDAGALPLYARLPIAKGLIAQDRSRGMRALDLTALLPAGFDGPADEVTLAKIEQVTQQQTMPPARYALIHWGSGFSAAESRDVLAWVKASRAAHYATGAAAPAMANEPVQPLTPPQGIDTAKAALGRALFHDVRLSGDNSLSCASCHALDKGGTDRAKTSTGIRGQMGPINSPTVYNAVFAVRQFWDGRAADLFEQASGPVHNPLEMGSNWGEVLPKLEGDAALMQQFLASYPALTGDNIADAIATFEATLVTTNARFDQYLMGKADAISAEERSGYELFKANACATCHVGKAMGGQSFEYMGHRRDYFADRGNVGEPDMGRFNATKQAADRYKFKVPTLRNIAQTAPYFHDASAPDLAAAVRTMSKYNGAREFTPAEVAKLVAFLQTLTGEFDGKAVV